MSGGTLIFEKAHRWPAAIAQAKPVMLTMTLSDGTPLPPRRFITITATGAGRSWLPEPVDATWRDLAETDLGDPAACQAFARRRGDPAGELSLLRAHPKWGPPLDRRPGRAGTGRAFYADPVADNAYRSVITSRWAPLAAALQQAASAWDPPDANGVSHPGGKARRNQAARFVDQPTAQEALKQVRIVRNPDGIGPAFQAETFAGFLVMSAWLAIDRALPMTRCRQCRSWFEMRRPGRFAQFCSASCRTLHHQEGSQHGLGTQELAAQRDAALASGVERARTGRQRAPANEELRQPQGGTGVRPSRRSRDRGPQRR
jgi:hypothetical protein